MSLYKNDAQYYINQYEMIYNNLLIDKCIFNDVQHREDDYFYFRILGISRIKETVNSIEMLSRVYTGLCGTNVPFSYIVKGTGKSIEIYIGTEKNAVEVLYRLFYSTIPEFYTSNEKNRVKKLFPISEIIEQYTRFGICKGIPCKREEQKEKRLFLDELISGMQGKQFLFRVDAEPLGLHSTHNEYRKWSSLLDESMEFSKRQISYANGAETVSYEKNVYLVSKFSELAEKYCEQYDKMEKMGSWITSIRYAVFSEVDKDILSGITLASLSGSNDILERMHIIDGGSIPYIDKIFTEDFISEGAPIIPKYSNLYSSEELAVLTLFPMSDYFGFSVKEAIPFELSGRDTETLSLGKIVYNGIITANDYGININDFNRHCFVSGLTGSGKTNTIKSLLIAMKSTSPEVKFLIIEPAKKEYWQLFNAGFSDLKIYTVGDSEGLEFRLNLFERVGNIPIQTHIDYVLAAFKASFIMYTPMPYVLERAIYSIYEDCGWNIIRNENERGMIYPTLDNLYYKIPLIVDEMGYEDKIQQDLVGSLQARIHSMRIGNKGKTLNVRQSTSIDEVLNGNVIIELENIADDEVKAFIISLILTQLMEYRLQQGDSQTELKHLLLFEEAHRLLKNVQGGTGENADPRGNAVDFFCNLLAELRSKGQGFIVADQIPSKLAPDIVKNTNIKIAHRIVDGEERSLIGNSMHMKDEQIEYLASLKQGCSIIYAEGDDRPKLVKAKYVGEYMENTYNREDILVMIRESSRFDYFTEKDNVSEVCARCYNQDCDGMRSKSICTGEIKQLIQKVAEDCQNKEYNNCYFRALIEQLKKDFFECNQNDFSEINCFINELVKKMHMNTVETSKFIGGYYKLMDTYFIDDNPIQNAFC